MVDMHLTIDVESNDAIFASFTCPCGCHPGAKLKMGEALATEGCCCGTEFALGHTAPSHIIERQYVARPGFQLLVEPVSTPWGPTVAAFAVGQDFSACTCGHEVLPEGAGHVVDPVCGMTIGIDKARAKGLTEAHDGTDYFFCSRGCRFDFQEDPARYLDPNYIPSM